ncbi:MAG TPA: M23 family metallopeptidase [Patescibacteria group bacterium]|nr:M23 family metallopeptidase [Patescibacteria group bacterium]
MLLVAMLVTVNSLRIRHAAAEDFGQNNLLFPLIIPDFELLITETDTGIMPGPAARPAEPGEESMTDTIQETQLGLSGTGAAILKPHLVTSAPGTAARTTVEYYTVEAGDTISGIAERFGLSVNTLLWENRLSSRSIIRIGQKLTILPTDGITYRIGRNDTVAKIAQRYGVAADNILAYNKISSTSLTIGQTIVIPGGRPPAPPAAAVARTAPISPITTPGSSSTRLLWPTDARRITQYYTWRHGGVDIAGPSGTAIYAAEEGIVEVAGWNRGGYGYYIIIDHGGGLKTLYAHNSKLQVAAGDRVERGQRIANVGSTGRSTGPHLHFEVRLRGGRTNPLNYIR